MSIKIDLISEALTKSSKLRPLAEKRGEGGGGGGGLTRWLECPNMPNIIGGLS
jgi:hypothetical protein